MVKYLFFDDLLCISTFILSLGLITSIVFYFFFYNSQAQILIRNDLAYNSIKKVLSISLCISFFIYVLYLYQYISIYNNTTAHYVFNKYKIVPAKTNIMDLNITLDLFGLILLFLAYFVGFLSFLALDNRLFWKNIKYAIAINSFILIVYLYITVNNILLFFLFYEFLLVPSFLIVYFISPSRRAIQASLYFLIWTQIGSILVLTALSYIVTLVGSSSFLTIRMFHFTKSEVAWLYFLLFTGFGFKVPIWPFHYWLTKTHVEAPAGFSMFLSGFLVKTAVYGFYKLTNLLGGPINTTIYSTICIMGVIDSSLKMWGQTDLKKLVAYGTIQEMNFIYLTFCWGDTNALISGILFSITHGALSALMFFLVDCLQRRFNSRSVVEISGVLQINPSLGISIMLMCFIYAGLPGTLKFTSEFYVFCGLFEISPVLSFFLFFASNVIGLIGFSKCWFDVVFGMNLKNHKTSPFDLTIKELYIIYSCIAFLFLFLFLANVVF